MPGDGGGGGIGTGDKPPGTWKHHEVQGSIESKEWILERIAEGYKCYIVAYKYEDASLGVSVGH